MRKDAEGLDGPLRYVEANRTTAALRFCGFEYCEAGVTARVFTQPGSLADIQKGIENPEMSYTENNSFPYRA